MAWTGIILHYVLFLLFFRFLLWKFTSQTPNAEKKKMKKTEKEAELASGNYHFEETSEAQPAIGRSLGVQTRALCCKCLRLCSMLT